MRAKTVVTSISRITERPAGNEACLVVIYGSELGKKYNLNASSMVIGRSSKCDIQIDQESISRNHSKIVNTGKSILVRDLGSTNGTYVNDEPVDEYVLRDGDLLKIGRTIFKFLTGGNIENAYHEEIYRLTTVDGLTQIFNKRYFVDTLEREVARAHRYRRALSLVMFDIDHFKKVNDGYGHLAGDYVLKHLAQTVRGKIRREDCFARYGGEEFAIVLPEIDNANCLPFAEKIRQIVERTEFKFENVR
ncbi:MAG TPA: GGDEF domain-containing protein, partial [Polyangia bacterium]|nr:GGDEF domain-containing protein [Polyangia bacterium]